MKLSFRRPGGSTEQPLGRSRTRVLALTAFLVLISATPADVLATEPPAARTLLLVRHGHYLSDRSADPRLGPGLSALGVAQARLAGARLAGLPFRFDAVFASPLRRATESAQVIVADLPELGVEMMPALAECTPPTWRVELVAGESKEAMAACVAQLDAFFKARFVPARGSERHELLVCHGNVTRYLVTKAMRVDPKAWLELSVGHASITTIRVGADGSFMVIGVGDRGHLSPNMMTGASGDPERDLAVPASR